MFKLFIFFITIIFASLSSLALSNNIVTSIRPLQSIVANITKNIDSNIGLVVDTNESIHNYNLKPLKAKEILKGNMIIIIDKDFEVFLDKIYKKIAQKKKNLIEVAKIPGIDLIESEHHHHENEEEAHHHSSHYDYHIWLDIDIVKVIAQNLTETFSIIDQKNHNAYYNNLAEFITKLNALDHSIKTKLSTISDKDFIVTHNAYQYFINRYKLKQPRILTIDHDHNIGAHDFMSIQEDLKNGKIQCIFEEPQFVSPMIKKLSQSYNNINLGTLDAEWGDSNASIEDNYFAIMNKLADSFSNCLR